MPTVAFSGVEPGWRRFIRRRVHHPLDHTALYLLCHLHLLCHLLYLRLAAGTLCLGLAAGTLYLRLAAGTRRVPQQTRNPPRPMPAAAEWDG